MSGAVGIDQESAIPIAGRCSFVAMHRLAGLLGCYAGCRTQCDSRDCGAETPTRSPAAPTGSGRVPFAASANRAALPYMALRQLSYRPPRARAAPVRETER